MPWTAFTPRTALQIHLYRAEVHASDVGHDDPNAVAAAEEITPNDEDIHDDRQVGPPPVSLASVGVAGRGDCRAGTPGRFRPASPSRPRTPS